MELLVSAKHEFLLPDRVINKAQAFIQLWSKEHHHHQAKTIAASAVYLAAIYHRLHVSQQSLCDHYHVSLQALRNFLRKVRPSTP